jgi:hypothetical protein
MRHWLKRPEFKASALLLLLPLVLTACLFLPGKFESTMTIHADRSFTFTYKGEVLAADLDGQMGDLMKMGEASKSEGADDSMLEANATEAVDNATDAEAVPTPEEEAAKAKEEADKKAKKEAEYREIAEQLAKEAGYKTVEYRGNGVFYVDYAISGVLTHSFVYPYDVDTAMIFPWLSVELRGKDTLKVKAPGFAKQDSSMGGMSGMAGSGAESKADGTFTLITDAEVISQNDETGSETSGATKTYRWKITPRTSDAPMAVLKVKGI